jgi:hypothetical protein
MYHELVGSGRMTAKAFHDGFLEQNNIPLALIRARLAGEKLTRDYKPNWRFYESK